MGERPRHTAHSSLGAAVMACNSVAGNVGRVLTVPVVRCSDFAHACRRQRRTRRLAPTAAAINTQRTPVQVNQLLIAKVAEQLVTTGQNASSADDPLQSEAEEFSISGPAEFSEQSTPYNAEQDWCERFAHYGRCTRRVLLLFEYVKCGSADLAKSFAASLRDLLGCILCGVRGRTWQARAVKMIRSNSGMGCEQQRLQVEGHISILVRQSHLTCRLTACFYAADDKSAMHFVNLYDRQLPGGNRNQMEHGLWQSSWYVTLSEICCQRFRPRKPLIMATQSSVV